MTNYNLGKIYKIVRKSDNALIYVGSTCEPMLCKRFDKHKRKAIEYPNRKVYKSISDNDGWNNHQILLIKLYPCNSRDELHSEESRFIRCLKPYGNIQIPMRTQKEYKIEYRTYNKEKIKLQSKTYNINNQEKIKQYRIDNKEKLKEKGSKIIDCCCGSTYTYWHKSHHFKTKQHINSIPVQFKIIEEMHKNRKQYIFPALPELKI